MNIEIKRNGKEAVAVIDDHYNLGLGLIADKTDKELIEIAKVKYEETQNCVYVESYKEKRAKEYLSIQDQLDLIYWDKVNVTSKWQEHIKSVKDKYPKSEE